MEVTFIISTNIFMISKMQSNEKKCTLVITNQSLLLKQGESMKHSIGIELTTNDVINQFAITTQ